MRILTRELFDSVVGEMKTAIDCNGAPIKMGSLIVSQENVVFKHSFQKEERLDIHSIAKPITCLAFGAAISEGLFFNDERVTLNTIIGPLLREIVSIDDPQNSRLWDQITLRDCFTITLGHSKGIMFTQDVKELDEDKLIDYVVNFPITGKPGLDFMYSNAGTFILSVLVTEYLGISLSEFVKIHLFDSLKITDYSWKSYGKYCAGCTGLKLHCEDLHKISQLLLNRGVFNDMAVVPSKWIDNMLLPLVHVPTNRYRKDRAFPKFSYGMNMWVCGNENKMGEFSFDGNYFCDGTNGQFIIIMPKNKMAISTVGYQADNEVVSRILGKFKM